MELASLKFVVDTKELETAATRIDELGTAVNKLNKPMQNLTKESAKSNKELSKAEEAAAKAALAQIKLEQAQTKSTESTGKSISVLERQTMILGYMATGLSKGQASYMATAKAAGALDAELEQLETTLKTQRSLIGGDAFDKSIGLMQKLSNETKVTEEVNKLFNQSLGLTEKQMIELAREKERLIALYKHEKKSLDGLDAEYQQIINKSVELNGLNDARTNSMRQQVKAQNDSAKANEYLAKEMERVNRLNSEGSAITSATNNRLIRFEKELRASGASAAEAATKLDAYRKSLLSAQKVAGDRQVDYLSRALGPQITDIAVGLATGQAPLTILLQQGGQLRDQFALAGVAGSEMGKMLVQASKAMVTGVKDIGLAVGQLVAGAITGSGKAITNFGMQVTGTSKLLDLARNKMIELAGANSALVTAFDRVGKVLTVTVGLAVAAAIASFIALGVAMADVIKEENALNRALNLTGAALGLSLDAAYSAARGMEEYGVSTGTALAVLTEMAKIGGMSADSLKMVATTASALKTAFDIPIEDTVKKFKELQEKPTESLAKLAIQLGTIPVEILKQVEAYEKAGNSVKAAELATKAYADAGKDAADRTVENFGIITRLGISLGKIWNSTWESIMGIGRIDTNDEKITNLSKRLVTLLAAQDPRQIANRKPLVDATIAEIQSTALQIAKEKELAEQRQNNSAEAAKFEKDRKEKTDKAKKITKELTEAEKERIAFLKVMSDLEDRASGFTKNYSDQLNLLNIGLLEGWLSQDQFNIKLQELNKVQPGVIKAHKDRADALAKMTEAQKKADDALFDSLDAEHSLNMQLLEQTQLLELEGSLIAATDAERKKALANKRLDLQLEKEIADIKKRSISKDEQDAQIARAEQRRLEAGKNINTEIAQDFAKKQLEEFDRISSSITDSIVTALIEGGEVGGKKLRDLIIAELKKPITLMINAVVNAALGSSTGAGSSNSLAGNLLGKAASSISIGGTSLATMGQYFATGFMNTVAGTGAAAGATAGGAIGGASGMAMQMGAYGPYALAAAAVLNALGAFRTTKQVGSGISGTLGGNIDQYATMRKSGTLFRGPEYFRRNQGTFAGNEAIQASFQQLKDSTKTMADTLKLSSVGVETFTKKIDISFDGLTNTQIEEKIASTLGSVNDELAALVLGAGATAEQLSSLYNSVMQQRYELETQLLELQGKTLELRERERAKIHEANQGLFDQIKALEDQKEANEKAAEAMEKLTSITTTIVDEINRLRGVNSGKSGLEAEFAILTAQARSGDLEALAKLPDVTKGLEQIAMSSAVNATDVIMARARLAQSLQDTLGYTGGFSASPAAVTSMSGLASVSTGSSASTVSATSSNQELLSALVVEVQGLRAEVRADVSHNAKTAKILERVNQDGETLSVSATIDGGVV